jgi:hypothetical protein
MPTVDDRLLRIERNILNLSRWSIDIMSTLQELTDLVTSLQAANVEAKADAARHAAATDNAVGLLQALSARIAELASQPTLVTQAQLDALALQAQAALTDATAANATRDAADAALAQATVDNTPTP